MKYAIAAIAVVAAIAGGALAQTTAPSSGPLPITSATAPPAATGPVAPSACPAYPAAPVLPAAATLRNQKAVNAGTETVNAWITQYQTVGSCRREEVTKLDAQLQARVGEFKAGNATAMQVRDQWQATVDATMAANQKKKK